MAKIYKRTDRIPVKIGDVTLKLAPLTIDQKTEIQQAMIKGRATGDIKVATKGIALSIKYSVKAIDGVTDSDDQPYKLQFEDGNLTDECVDDLLNLEITSSLTMVCVALVNGIPNEFTDNNGNKLEGVEIVKPAKVEPPNPN